MSDSAAPIELTIRGARKRLAEIDTPASYLFSIRNRYTTYVVYSTFIHRLVDLRRFQVTPINF